MRNINYIPGIQGVADGAVATLNIPVNRRYHSIHIQTLANGVAADATLNCSLVELMVNGIVMRSGKPKTFIDLGKLYGYTASTGEIPLFFSEFWRNESPGSMELTSWDLFGQSTFTMRLTLLSPAGSVGISSVLADFDSKRNTRLINGQQVPFPQIVKQTDMSFVLGSGLNDITTLPTSFPILRLLADVSANAISKVELFGDGNVKLHEATKTENVIMLNSNLLVAGSYEYPLVLDYDNRVLQALKTTTLDYRVTTSGALTLTMHVHQLVNGFR